MKPSSALGFTFDNHLADLVKAADRSSLPPCCALYSKIQAPTRPRLRTCRPACGLAQSPADVEAFKDHGSELGKACRRCTGTRFSSLTYFFVEYLYFLVLE